VRRFPVSTPRFFHNSRLSLQDHKPEEHTEGKPEAVSEKTPALALLEKKDAEIEELKKKYLTSLADMQNLRTRTQNDVNAAKKYAGTEFAKSMLEVADNLGFAIKAAAPDATDSNPKLKTFYEGVTMIQHALSKAFASNSVVMYKSLGEKFDPNLHNGLYQFEDPTKEPGTVGNVVKEGYKLSDRVLRAAQVGTIKAPAPQAPANSVDEKSSEQLVIPVDGESSEEQVTPVVGKSSEEQVTPVDGKSSDEQVKVKGKSSEELVFEQSS
jgi:molecular chaperone GrpE